MVVVVVVVVVTLVCMLAGRGGKCGWAGVAAPPYIPRHRKLLDQQEVDLGSPSEGDIQTR